MSGKYNRLLEKHLLKNDESTNLRDRYGELYCICINSKFDEETAIKMAKDIINYENNNLHNTREFKFQNIEKDRLEIDIDDIDTDIDTVEFPYFYENSCGSGIYSEIMWIATVDYECLDNEE